MTDEEKAKKYAICRTYPHFETDFIANFVLREVEAAFLAGLKVNTSKKLYEAKEIITIMKDLLFNYWGYNEIKFEERVDNFLKELNK